MTWNPKPILDRLDEKTIKGASNVDCWEWTGTKNNMGYGMIQMKVDGKHGKRLAHRVSYQLRVGPIPANKCVLHKCDNPECTNPEHLFLGTKKENYDDMVAKGRRINVWPGHLPGRSGFIPAPQRGDNHWTRKRPSDVKRGENNGFAKLTEDNVRTIYSMRLNGRQAEEIARHFHVDPSTVGDIINGEHWSHMLGTDGCPTLDDLRAIKTPKTIAKLSVDQVRSIKSRLASGETGKSLAAEFKVNEQSISDIKLGRSWKWLTP